MAPRGPPGPSRPQARAHLVMREEPNMARSSTRWIAAGTLVLPLFVFARFGPTASRASHVRIADGTNQVAHRRREDARPSAWMVDDIGAVQILTARECAVLPLLAAGASTSEVATIFVVSPKAIEYHIRHLAEKFQARNRTETIAKAYHLGYLTVDLWPPMSSRYPANPPTR
jgi:DNA-binding CsgD family transcriptional regulator